MSLALRMIALFRTQGVAWSETDKASEIALTADELTATRSSTLSGENYVNVRSTSPQSAGKLYFEITAQGSITSLAQVSVGICSSAYALQGSFALPGALQEPDSIGYWYYTGEVRAVNSVLATPGIITGSETSCFAIDIDAEMFWARKGGGFWNADSLADPATGSGGLSFPPDLSGVPVYMVASVRLADGTGAILNGGSSAFTQTIPTGFTPWGLV